MDPLTVNLKLSLLVGLKAMKHLVITGANRGIGLALCKHYLQAGWYVTACCRAPDKASELQAQMQPKLKLVALDITNEAQRIKLAETLTQQPIDLLINNAGMYGPKGYALAELDFKAWERTMQTNVFATTALTLTLLPLMNDPSKIAFLSSKMGSMGDNSSGGAYIYRSSKAALNAVIKSLSVDLAPIGISVASLHPGWVQTDMGGPNALIDASTSAKGLAKQIDQLDLASSGCFVDYSGKRVPW